MKSQFHGSRVLARTWRSCLLTFITASLLSLGHNVHAQLPSLNIGFVDAPPDVFVEFGYPVASANETREMFRAVVRQVVAEAQAENLFPGYQLNIVSASVQSNTFQGMYQAAKELIDQNVAMIVTPQRNVGLREYFISIVWGLRIPVVALSCLLKTEVDYPCLSVALSGISYMWAIDALRRLGFNRAVGVYNPNVFAQDVIELMIQSAPDMQIRTLQLRTQTPQEMVSQILSGRETAVLTFTDQIASFIPLVRQAVGNERAQQLTFISAISELITGTIPGLFPNTGDENGVFDVTRAPFPFSSGLYDLLAAREGWNATTLNLNTLRFVTSGLGSLMYAPTKVWMYGFSELIKNASAAVISTNYRSRPVVNRPVYLSNFKRLGIDGYVQNFSRTAFFIPQSWIRNFKLNSNRTGATYSFLGIGSAPGLITNATFADGTSNRPPTILSYPTVRIFQSQVYYAAYALGGISIAYSIFLTLMLIGLRSRESVKSASWVFLGTTLTGTMLLALVLFPAATDPTYAGCIATPVLLSISVHLILVSISVKAFRLHLIFANKLNRKIKLRDPQLAAILALTYVPDLAILIVWLTNSPLEPVMVETGTVQSLRCVTRSGGFAWGLFGYGLAKLLVALRFTYLTRNVYSKYNETKSVLFAVYTVMVGIAIAIASFAVQDLGREGQIILLLIALSSASIGTSTAIAGYRIFFALQDGEGISSQTTGASPGMTAKKPSPTKSNPIATSSAPWANATTGSERAYGETQLKGFHASIRERRLWFSRWTACWICTSHGGSLIISFVKNEKGGTAEWFHGLKLDVLRFIRSIKADAASNSATQYFGVEIGAPTTSYEIVFESEGAASDFMKECEHLVNNAPADSTE